MMATTSPEDYRRFDDAQAVEFYTEPTRVPGPLVLSPTSDWDELSRASTAGSREPMESVIARIEYPGEECRGLPIIHLDFAYAGDVAIPIFWDCHKFDATTNDLTMRLWRFRIIGRGEAIELCFRAVLPDAAISGTKGQRTRFFGTFTVLDAQPFIEGV